jgi:hypothetical protein
MPSFGDWTEKDVIFKLSSVEEALMGTVRHADDSGIWMKSPDLPVAHRRRSASAQHVIIHDSIFFVPMSQVEWVMSADPRSAPSTPLQPLTP